MTINSSLRVPQYSGQRKRVLLFLSAFSLLFGACQGSCSSLSTIAFVIVAVCWRTSQVQQRAFEEFCMGRISDVCVGLICVNVEMSVGWFFYKSC